MAKPDIIKPPTSAEHARAMLIRVLRADDTDDGAQAFSDLLDRSNAAIVAGMSSYDAIRLAQVRDAAHRFKSAADDLDRATCDVPTLALARTGRDGLFRRLGLEARRLGLDGREAIIRLGELMNNAITSARALPGALERLSPAGARRLRRGADQDPKDAMADGIAAAVMDVPGVNGSVLALLAVLWGLELPVSAGDEDVWETRRKRWDERLRATRVLRDRGAESGRPNRKRTT